MGQASLPVKMFLKRLTYDLHVKRHGDGVKAYIWHLLLEKWQLSHNFLQSNKQVVYGKIITAYGTVPYWCMCKRIVRYTLTKATGRKKRPNPQNRWKKSESNERLLWPSHAWHRTIIKASCHSLICSLLFSFLVVSKAMLYHTNHGMLGSMKYCNKQVNKTKSFQVLKNIMKQSAKC